MLKLLSTLTSYCSSCSRPSQVGVFEAEGWPHKLLLCASCLRGKAGEIERGGAALPPANGDDR